MECLAVQLQQGDERNSTLSRQKRYVVIQGKREPMGSLCPGNGPMIQRLSMLSRCGGSEIRSKLDSARARDSSVIRHRTRSDGLTCTRPMSSGLSQEMNARAGRPSVSGNTCTGIMHCRSQPGHTMLLAGRNLLEQSSGLCSDYECRWPLGGVVNSYVDGATILGSQPGQQVVSAACGVMCHHQLELLSAQCRRLSTSPAASSLCRRTLVSRNWDR